MIFDINIRKILLLYKNFYFYFTYYNDTQSYNLFEHKKKKPYFDEQIYSKSIVS